LLEIAGVTMPDRMQGKSLVPLLKGKTPNDWRTAFYYHYYEFPADHFVRPHYGIITTNYTLVHFYKPDAATEAQAKIDPGLIPNDYWELFDREKDPGELNNVYGNPAYAEAQAKLMSELARQREKLKEPLQDDPKSFGARGNYRAKPQLK
jgi:arylsulfatase A-like enzyme